MGSLAKVNFGQKSKLFSFLRLVQYSLKFLRFGNCTRYCGPKRINNNEVILFGVENGKKLKNILEKLRTL